MLSSLSNRRLALRRDDRGATAIEYAIIGALIGIGLVGSLVGTRTSLSAIFGVAANQMASASGTSASSSQGGLVLDPSNSRAAYWGGKTVASGPIHTSNASVDTWTTKFTDGSQVDYNVWKTAPLATLVSREADTLFSMQTAYYNGKLDSVNANKYSNATFTNETYGYYSNSFDANNTPKNVSYGACSGSSCNLNNTTTSPQASFVQQVKNGVADVALFSANTPP